MLVKVAFSNCAGSLLTFNFHMQSCETFCHKSTDGIVDQPRFLNQSHIQIVVIQHYSQVQALQCCRLIIFGNVSLYIAKPELEQLSNSPTFFLATEAKSASNTTSVSIFFSFFLAAQNCPSFDAKNGVVPACRILTIYCHLPSSLLQTMTLPGNAQACSKTLSFKVFGMVSNSLFETSQQPNAILMPGSLQSIMAIQSSSSIPIVVDFAVGLLEILDLFDVLSLFRSNSPKIVLQISLIVTKCLCKDFVC